MKTLRENEVIIWLIAGWVFMVVFSFTLNQVFLILGMSSLILSRIAKSDQR
jgi:hypothetical protein